MYLNNISFRLGAYEFVRLVVTIQEGSEVIGSNTADHLVGSAGCDTIFGNNGSDNIVGQLASDFLDGGSGMDKVVSGRGDDTVRGGSGSDVLAGQQGRDHIIGGVGDDLILGGYGNDILVGGGGQDTLKGGFGRDVLTGGSESDVFVFDTALRAGAADIITDFDTAEDKILLNSNAFVGLARGDIGGLVMTSNGLASDADNQIFYDPSSGKFYFSEVEEGFSNSIHFLTLSPGISLVDLSISVI